MRRFYEREDFAVGLWVLALAGGAVACFLGACLLVYRMYP